MYNLLNTFMMEYTLRKKLYADWLIFLGVLMFLLGLFVGILIPIMTLPRMGLSAHLEGIMNGMFVVILGLIWNKIALSDEWLTITFWLTIYSSFTNFLTVTFSAITGFGKLMPLAGGKEGTPAMEGVISFLLISLALALIAVCCIVLTGLFKNIKQSTAIGKN